ncbi:methyltransferase domain-containing protein [Streptosporangium sp. NPDC006930]|uniref:methyltransferase domain-containing protein n=1 Tax=unclassified Streptosporangium TaxID=2632669 RepID=UPI003421136E
MNTQQPLPPEVRRRLEAMVAGLKQSGALVSPRWVDAFTHVPRHVFVPHLFTQEIDGRGITVWCPLDGGDREAWLDAAYSDTTLVTALDEDTVEPTDNGGMTGFATPSSTAPSLMARMLEDLRVEDGQRLLEVGTGTGYNAALLSYVLGDQRVHSVDIHPALVEAARERLASVGFKPALVSGDGRHGFPEHAPYDRIIATCSVTAVPRAWLEQTRPGGVILTDVASGIEGGLVRLSVGEDLCAEGRFTPTTGRFMPSRHGERTYEQPRRPTYAPVSGTRYSMVNAAVSRPTTPSAYSWEDCFPASNWSTTTTTPPAHSPSNCSDPTYLGPAPHCPNTLQRAPSRGAAPTTYGSECRGSDDGGPTMASRTTPDSESPRHSHHLHVVAASRRRRACSDRHSDHLTATSTERRALASGTRPHRDLPQGIAFGS